MCTVVPRVKQLGKSKQAGWSFSQSRNPAVATNDMDLRHGRFLERIPAIRDRKCHEQNTLTTAMPVYLSRTKQFHHTKLEVLKTMVKETDSKKTLFADLAGWGRFIISAAPYGVTRIQLEPAGTVQQLFPFMVTPEEHQSITTQDEIHWQVMQQIQQYLAGQRQKFDLPVGILFAGRQKTILGLVAAIPYGQTLTYSQIAQKAGLLEAQKQIPAILKLNSIGLLIPSHRVVKDSHDIGNFIWGRKIKQRLLELEAKYHKHIKKGYDNPEV